MMFNDAQEAAVTSTLTIKKVLWDAFCLVAHCAMGPDTPPEEWPRPLEGGGRINSEAFFRE